jgi:hypothetical protein
MGITADHPFAIVDIEGKTYLASLYGIHEAKGTFEPHGGYKTYTPSPEDKIPYKLMTVWNFDEALVYELLENLEVLRQISLGNEIENLPRTLESGKQIAEQYKDQLQATSWRDIQNKVLPELSEYFRDTDNTWKLEVDRVGVERWTNELFKQVMEAGQSATTLKDLPFDEFKKQFLPIAKEHKKTVADLMTSDTEPPSETPLDVVNFAKRAREAISAIDIPELRDEVTRGFLRPFVEKQESLTEE